MRRLIWSFAFVGACAVACSSGSPPPPAGAAAGRTSHTTDAMGGDPSSSAGGAAAGEAGAPGSQQGGAAGDGVVIGQLGGAGLLGDSGGAPEYVEAACKAAADWGTPSALAGIATEGADERLLALTHDELTLVFSRGDQLFVADRASASADFAGATELALPVGYVSSSGVALSDDGRGLVLVSSDGKGFGQVSRATRSGAFADKVSVAPFVAINQIAVQNGGSLSGPVLTADGGAFLYGLLTGSTSNVYLATFASSAKLFNNPLRLDHVVLGSDDGKLKLTQSISSDLQTLFVLDLARGDVSGVWNQAPRGAWAFTESVQFQGLESAFSNAGCTRLYGTEKLGATLDVVVLEPK
jgi:hypothetical protein